MTLRSTSHVRALGARPRTPTSGVLVEALFALVALSAAAMSAIFIGKARERPPPDPARARPAGTGGASGEEPAPPHDEARGDRDER